MTTSAPERRSLVPPSEHEKEFEQLARFLNTAQDTVGSEAAFLVSPTGDRQEIPSEVFEVLSYIVSSLAEGKGVTVMPTDAQLTTQQAADHLGISRPTLVKLLEQGEIPFTKVGRHRRVTLEDLMQYESAAHEARRQTLRDLTQEAASQGHYFDPPETTETR
jgi:excisionase family DNA binding protein